MQNDAPRGEWKASMKASRRGLEVSSAAELSTEREKHFVV